MSDDSDLELYYQQGLYFIKPCQITDYPTYKLRKLLIDSARHYLPFDAIKRQINGLALSRMNTLHFHIVDSQSNSFWPSTSPADAMINGAWYNGGRFYYDVDDMGEIAQYAHNLGIHIMIEYDMPGHASSWRKADESIVANCPLGGYTSVNPYNELTYTYIRAYLQDLLDSVYTPFNKTPLLHLGGDEVDHNCWKEDSSIN